MLSHFRTISLGLSALPSLPPPSNQRQVLIQFSVQLLPPGSPLPWLFFRLFLTFLKELLCVSGSLGSARALPGLPLPSRHSAPARVGCSGLECAAKTGQRETTSAFLLREPGAALDKPILPTLHEAQPALVRDCSREKPHILTGALRRIPVSTSWGLQRGLQRVVLEQGQEPARRPRGHSVCGLPSSEGAGSLILRMFFPEEHFSHWLMDFTALARRMLRNELRHWMQSHARSQTLSLGGL